MPSYTNLILRTLTSPYGDITRGGVLSWNDVDQNFLYLKGESIYDAVSSGGTITLKKYNSFQMNRLIVANKSLTTTLAKQ